MLATGHALAIQSALAAVGGALPLPRALHIVLQLCEASGEAHAQGIVHRDLKPGNILVTNGQVQVLDFGLAAQRGIQGTSGTLNYMAPEILYDEPVSESSDLYAVGVMAYELFAGRHPFADATNATELITHIFETTPDVSALPISFDLQNVIARLLDNGLICGPAGPNVLRFLPPLVATPADLGRGLCILEGALTASA